MSQRTFFATSRLFSQVLNAEYIEEEADPRHLVILMAERRPVLDAAERSQYRSSTMCAAYVSQNRPDVQYASKKLAQCMEAPTTVDSKPPKRMVRYLIQAGGVVQRFEQQPVQTMTMTMTHSDMVSNTVRSLALRT